MDSVDDQNHSDNKEISKTFKEDSKAKYLIIVDPVYIETLWYSESFLSNMTLINSNNIPKHTEARFKPNFINWAFNTATAKMYREKSEKSFGNIIS